MSEDGFLKVDQSGKVSIKASRWFSHEITRDEWPWVFEKSSKPALVISTLEALAVLVALKVYYGEESRTDRSSIRIVPTTTDNRGNGTALNKLMNTRYPASAVLMELATCSKKMGLKASVEWSLWEANREADAKANGDFSLFTPELRIPVPSQRLQWTILHQALDHGRAAEEAHRAAKPLGLPEEPEEKTKKTTGGETENGGPFRFNHTHGHLHTASLSMCSRLRLSSISLFRWSPVSHHSALGLFIAGRSCSSFSSSLCCFL